MKTRSSLYHRQNGYLLIGHNLQQRRAITLDQPSKLRLHIVRRYTALSLHTHRLAQLDKVGVLLMSVRESILVEYRLPLRDHTLLLVIENDDLNADVELSGRAEFGLRHAEGCIAIDVYDQSVGTSYFGTDGGWQAEAHSSQATRCDHGSGMSPSEVLRRPHLMLTHTSCDYGLFFHILGHDAQLLNYALRLDEAVWSLFFIGEG